jgi:hypothetical protein
MKTTIAEYVQGEIEDCLKKVAEGEAKMAENYTYNFEWGYPEQIYYNKYMAAKLQHMAEFIGKEPELAAEWLNTNIGWIEERLFRGDFHQSSTNQFSNIAYRIKIECDAKLRELYVRWLKWITDKDTPIV